VAFRNEINTTLRNEIHNLHDDDKEDFATLSDELIDTLEYIDHTMIVTPVATNIQLTFSVEGYERFNNNIGFLRFDLSGFQEWHHERREYEKADAFGNAQNLIDIFIRLLGNNRILDSSSACGADVAPLTRE
jgi:hypothetical protein